MFKQVNSKKLIMTALACTHRDRLCITYRYSKACHCSSRYCSTCHLPLLLLLHRPPRHRLPPKSTCGPTMVTPDLLQPV